MTPFLQMGVFGFIWFPFKKNNAPACVSQAVSEKILTAEE